MAPIPRAIEVALYRALQEALTNARKHADMIGYVVGVIMCVQLFFLAR